MSLHKIYNFVGYNNLGLLLEQERKHWMLKPDKKLNVQDSATGSIFQGRIDNMGNEIVVETNKTNAYTGSDMFRFTDDMFNVVFEPLSSTLPYNNALNGLMYECIISSKVAYVNNNVTSYKNYKLKFVDCEEVLIPFGDSLDTPNVYAGRWLKTTSNPVVILPDSTNVYNIEIPLEYEDSVTGCVYYYPLEENMQPLSITNVEQGVYVTEAVTDSTFIGYPIYWFTSDNTNVGPGITISNNVSSGHTLMYVANPGDVSKYNTQIFCSVDGNEDAAPNGDSTSEWKVVCETITGDFTGSVGDILIPIDMNSVKLVKVSDNTEYDIHFVSDNEDVLTLTSIELWVRNGNTAWTLMSNFDRNCYQTQQTEQHIYELIPLFNLHLDENVSFLHNTTDVGYAGVHMTTEPYMESGERYPYDLGKWDGIPEWIQNNEEGAPQHVALYAIHNTPNYNENDPKSRQTTAILLDPGKPKTSDSEEYEEDEKGRAYLLSNDDAVYDNNATSEHPKPDRTIARICDIPSTITQLTNITGLAPTTVVDKNYVHTDACYTEDEKEKLWNTLSNRWVRPTMLSGITYDNDFIFNNVDDLNAVNLYSVENDLCEHLNLNSSVDPHNIVVDLIAVRGSNYEESDTGVVIIGGTSITYVVNAVDENGGVTEVSLEPTSETPINLSNFDLADAASGHTAIYGTSPVYSTAGGTGLKFSMRILGYDAIRPKRGELYPDLYALVRHPDGLWLYQHHDEWEKSQIVSEAESSTIITGDGGLSTTDAYMTSIVSCIRTLPVNSMSTGGELRSLNVMSTPTFVNVLDTNYIPFTPVPNMYINKSTVDMTKLVCPEGIRTGHAIQKSGAYVIKYLKDNNLLKYDSYVVWKWNDPDPYNDNTYFTYGIVTRSFNNLQSTDSTTLLPANNLNCQSYVHTNEQTTIVWNVEGVGVLMWVYDPRNSIYEKYSIDKNTMDISIKREDYSFRNIDVYNNPNFQICDTDGRLLYNIWTNNPQQNDSWIEPGDPIYQQPNFTPLASIGTPVDNVRPRGCWRLIYPRVNSYSFVNSSDGTTFDAIKMDVIRGDNLGVIGNIKNQYGQVVNNKILVLDRQTGGTAMKAYNNQTNTWDKV